MLTLSQATNAPRTITLAGRNYSVSALRLGQWGDLNAWLMDRSSQPQPIDQDAIDPSIINPEISDFLKYVQELAIAWPPRVTTSAWFAVLESTDGGRTRLVWEAIRVHRPDFSETDAANLVVAQPSDEEWSHFLKVLIYADPNHIPPKLPCGKRNSIVSDDWGSLIGFLTSSRGWSYGELSMLTLPQLYNEIEQAEREAGKARGPRTTAAQARAALDAVKRGAFGGNGKNSTGH
jgi:hypothetical protein